MAKILSVAIVLCASVFIIACPTPEDDTQGYVLAFADESTSNIRVRWSNDGAVWDSANFRDASTNLGVGAAGDTVGVVRIVPWTNTVLDRVEFVWGIGAIFDENDYEATTQTATSAPSAVYNANGRWIIAYRTDGNVVAVRTFDSQDRRFLDVDCAPIENALNDQVVGRPALVRLGDQLVLSWQRGTSSLRMAVGNIMQSACTEWHTKYGFDAPSSVGESCYSGIYSGPTLTHDHGIFYLGYTQRTSRCSDDIGGDFLVREDFFLHTSTDGITWSEPILLTTVPQRSYVNIAGRSDGSIIAAFVGGTEAAVYRYSQGVWTEMDASSVFGVDPKPYTQFALVAVGRPPVEN